MLNYLYHARIRKQPSMSTSPSKPEGQDTEKKNKIWTPQVWWVPILVALIGLIGVLIPLINGGSAPPTDKSFEYSVRIEEKATGKPIANAEVTIEVINQAPMREVTDSNGVARVFVDTERAGQPGRLIVQASGYDRYIENIDLEPDKLSTVILLVMP
jgi:hypothetical protein